MSTPNAPQVLYGFHPLWTGPIHLHRDGKLVRPGVDTGTYRLVAGQSIELIWDKWPIEKLEWDIANQQFVCPQKAFTLLDLAKLSPPIERSATAQNKESNLSPPRILIAICTCSHNTAKRNACRDTWIKRIPKNTDYFFFLGNDPNLKDTEKVVQLPVKDSYETLPSKVQCMLQYAITNFQFDYLFKCDDDTYIAPERLQDLTKLQSSLVSFVWNNESKSASGGAGYLLSHKAVQRLADANIPKVGYEDVIVTTFLRLSGFAITHTNRLQPNIGSPPSPKNDKITSHWCSPKDMHSFDDQWKGHTHLSHKENNINCEVTVNTLIVELEGGMGNQMFQYAHGLALSKMFNLKLHFHHVYKGGTKRMYNLHYFGLLESLPQEAAEDCFSDYGGKHHKQDWPSIKHLKESSAQILKIRGFFQNEDYFYNVRDEIAKQFSVTRAELDLNHQATPVCLQIRRGDFVGHSIHDVCTEKYYYGAIEKIHELFSHPVFIVISDDPLWCKEFLKDYPNISILYQENELHAFQYMAACEAFIISNSSFGWWGAWLAGDVPVIAPSKYLKDTEWVSNPPQWIELPV